MRRLFWLAMGVTIGILVVRKASRTAQQLSPDALASRAGGALTGVGQSIKAFATDVRAGMAQRETELRDGAGFDGKLGAKPDDFR